MKGYECPGSHVVTMIRGLLLRIDSVSGAPLMVTFGLASALSCLGHLKHDKETQNDRFHQ